MEFWSPLFSVAEDIHGFYLGHKLHPLFQWSDHWGSLVTLGADLVGLFFDLGIFRFFFHLCVYKDVRLVAGIMVISICFSGKPTDPETQKFKLQTWEYLKKKHNFCMYCICFDHSPWRFVFTVLHMNCAGIIKLPMFVGIKQCTCMETFEGFHLNSSLFWVGNMMTSVPRCSM